MTKQVTGDEQFVVYIQVFSCLQYVKLKGCLSNREVSIQLNDWFSFVCFLPKNDHESIGENKTYGDDEGDQKPDPVHRVPRKRPQRIRVGLESDSDEEVSKSRKNRANQKSKEEGGEDGEDEEKGGKKGRGKNDKKNDKKGKKEKANKKKKDKKKSGSG